MKEDYWSKKIIELVNVINGLAYNNDDRKYIQEVGNLLNAVLKYHDGNDNEIIGSIQPIYKRGKNANPMLYALAADYLGLCYYKNAKKILNDELGLKRLWFTELEDFLEFKKKLENPEVNPSGFKFMDILKYAISAFDCVIELEKEMQENHNNWYIWRSYAMYNKARCEFILYCVDKFTKDDEKINWKNWQQNLVDSCKQRKEDFEKAKDNNIARDITHNLEAEYYHAVYECKIYQSLIKFVDEKFKVINDEVLVDSNFIKWTKQSLLLGDTIDVFEKAKKYNVLEEKKQIIKEKKQTIENCKAKIDELDSKLNDMKKEYEAIKEHVKKKEREKFDNPIAEIDECIKCLQMCKEEERYEKIIYVFTRMNEIDSITDILRKENEEQYISIKENTKSIFDCLKNIVLLLGSKEIGLIVEGLILLKEMKIQMKK